MSFQIPKRVLSWAPLGGGLKIARQILNCHVAPDDRLATESPIAYLADKARRMGHRPDETVAMMTGADVTRASFATVRHDWLTVAAWCTAGCSNALAVGDPATVERTRPGTINLIVALNHALGPAAMIEAVQIAVEARVVALRDARIRSTRSRRFATGTGTDCIAIATPLGARAEPWCGKHTRIGELIGVVVMHVCAEALTRRAD